MTQKTNPYILIVGILCITIIELCALWKGMDGLLLTTVIAIIAAAVGISIPTPKILGGK